MCRIKWSERHLSTNISSHNGSSLSGNMSNTWGDKVVQNIGFGIKARERFKLSIVLKRNI